MASPIQTPHHTHTFCKRFRRRRSEERGGRYTQVFKWEHCLHYFLFISKSFSYILEWYFAYFGSMFHFNYVSEARFSYQYLIFFCWGAIPIPLTPTFRVLPMQLNGGIRFGVRLINWPSLVAPARMNSAVRDYAILIRAQPNAGRAPTWHIVYIWGICKWSNDPNYTKVLLVTFFIFLYNIWASLRLKSHIK